jgi:hypothetical protein
MSIHHAHALITYMHESPCSHGREHTPDSYTHKQAHACMHSIAGVTVRISIIRIAKMKRASSLFMHTALDMCMHRLTRKTVQYTLFMGTHTHIHAWSRSNLTASIHVIHVQTNTHVYACSRALHVHPHIHASPRHNNCEHQHNSAHK